MNQNNQTTLTMTTPMKKSLCLRCETESTKTRMEQRLLAEKARKFDKIVAWLDNKDNKDHELIDFIVSELKVKLKPFP